MENQKLQYSAHLDSIGFTVKYNNEIVKIGGPVSSEGIVLIGKDSLGKIEGKIVKKKIKYLLIFIEKLKKVHL